MAKRSLTLSLLQPVAVNDKARAKRRIEVTVGSQGS